MLKMLLILSIMVKITQLRQNPFSCGHDDLIFDWTVVRSSLTADMGFTCDNDHLFSIFNAGYMLGMLTGAFVLGIIADKASLSPGWC